MWSVIRTYSFLTWMEPVGECPNISLMFLEWKKKRQKKTAFWHMADNKMELKSLVSHASFAIKTIRVFKGDSLRTYQYGEHEPPLRN